MMNDVCIKHYKCFKKPTIKIGKLSGKPVTSSGLLSILHQIKKLNKQYYSFYFFNTPLSEKKSKPTVHLMKSIEYSLTSISIDCQLLYRQQCLILKIDIFLFYSQNIPFIVFKF